MPSKSGKVVEKIVSSVSSPAVNYSVSYTATRASEKTAEVTVVLNFDAWLNSSMSSLGTGIKLTAFARLGSSGEWTSAIVKQPSSSWRGTTRHDTSLTLAGNITADKAKIEFYISRTGSTYGGIAGELGRASAPKAYTVPIPEYGSSPTPTPEPECQVFTRYNGVCIPADIYVETDIGTPYINIAGEWETA